MGRSSATYTIILNWWRGDDVMEICKEMIKLRKGLDERGIVWIDASETYGNDKIKALGIDITIHRTQFTAYGVWFSVIYGHGTYGNESGLLECMSNAVDKSGEPKGSMTADEILEVIDELKK